MTKYDENHIENVYYKEHMVDGNVVDPDKSQQMYTFTISDTNDAILYSDGYICIDVKILDNVEDSVTLVNTGNVFTRGTLQIGGHIIEEISKPSLVHFIHSLGNFTKDYESSEATNMFIFKDTADSSDREPFTFVGNLDEKMPSLIKKIKKNEKYNKGFDQRCNLTKGSKLTKIVIPLYLWFGFFNDFRKLMTGIEVKFEFMRNELVNNMLYTNVNNKVYKVSIPNITLWLPHVRLNPEVSVKYLAFLESNKDLEIEWVTPILRESDSLGDSSGTIPVKLLADDIVSILVIPQCVERENNENQNNMVFDNLDLTSCSITVNDIRYPKDGYKLSFKEGEINCSLPYLKFLKIFGNVRNTESGCLIALDECINLYPIIPFDTSNHPPFINVKNLNIEFSWNLRNTPAKKYRFGISGKEMQKGPRGSPGIGFKLTDDGNYDMEKEKLKNVDEPVDISDVATKSYVDSNKIEFKSDTVKLQKISLIHSEHGDFDARNKIIGNVKDPINNLNVVNKQYLENNALTLSLKNTIPIEKFYNVNTIPLKNLSNPQDKNDAVHKQYVDEKTKINYKKPDNMLTRDHDGLYIPNETFLATQEYIMHTYPAVFRIVFNKFTSLLLSPDLRLKTDMLMKITFYLRELNYNPFI
ncbi:uncharacterized protein CDAR_554241 [Caerostris darwini]|uniref:Double jelly roll-like domain-containing protein n=1 Tax=Caerostris darwini TaxID=1538125 RepID=A0AAV4Q3J7_9ARAC|nr:uncharacterized protein CDAR_554241 [Caerostris darwini]